MVTIGTARTALMLAALAAAAAAYQRPASADDRLQQARAAMDAGRLDQAAELAGSLVSDPALKAYALHLRAEVLFRKGDLQNALADFIAARDSSGGAGPLAQGAAANAAMVLSVISNRKLEDSDAAGALTSAEAAKRMCQEYAPAWFSAGSVKAGLGDYEGAAADFTRFLDMKPGLPAQEAAARHMLGMIEWDSWNLPAAREHIAAAAKLDPETPLYARELKALDEATENVKRTVAAERRLAMVIACALALWIAAGAFFARRSKGRFQ